MAEEPKGLFKVGAVSLVLSGTLFLVKLVLDLVTGPPPSTGIEILAWITQGKLALAFVNEALFIAGMLVVPGAAALHASLRAKGGNKAVVGIGCLAVTLPVLFSAVIVHGRLIYPVYGIQVRDPLGAELAVALYAGGMHAVSLMLAIATVLLSLAMGSTYGRPIAYLGFVAAVFDVVGSYPWELGAPVRVLSQVVPAAWLIAVGSKLWMLGAAPSPRSS
jgi:hypothetical protein